MKNSNSFQQHVQLAPSNQRLAPRSAISLIEVLISMGVLAVGLLSVAALFPVGGYYMRKGEISDRGAAIAQNAFSDIVARGVLNPDNWLAMGSSVQDPNAVGAMPADETTTLDYNKPVLWRLRHAIRGRRTGFLPATDQEMNSQFGSVFVIDPLGTAGFSETASISGTGAIRFPYNSDNSLFGLTAGQSPASPKWEPWKKVSSPARNYPNWPIARLTVRENSIPMNLAVARTIFSSRDDLVIDVPSDGEPSTQPWDVINDLPLSRQSQGDYSMLVTVAPATQEARDGLADDPTAHTYSVSVVVFYKRVLGDVLRGPYVGGEYSSAEHLVRARVMSKGLSGGELLLSNNVGLNLESFEDFKAGQWISLFGPHPQSTNDRQIFFFQWYRVIAVEGEDDKLDAFGNPDGSSTTDRRVVSLRGPAWPWEASSDSDTDILSNDLRVGIFPGAVAVHSKTMRLEGNSLWSVD